MGQAFRVTTAGESHGLGSIVIIDGCPPGLSLSEEDLLIDLQRRRPAQSSLVSQRKEQDQPRILSGVFEGQTTGTPIAILIENEDQRPKDYAQISQLYRPGHADMSYQAKYGLRDYRGGGRASARETAVRVAAGAVAKKLLKAQFGTRVLGYVQQVGDVVAQIAEPAAVDFHDIEYLPDGSPNPVRCPDHAAAQQMIALIETVRKDKDSVGGIAQLVAVGVPAGLGEPVFDKLKAELGHALFSIPAVMGVEYGSGFGCAHLLGSAHNDIFEPGSLPAQTKTNRHGGMLGGISTGMPLLLRAAVKPTSSLPAPQPTVDLDGNPATVMTKGRHDPCVLPRFIPIAEAMIALVLVDHWLRHRGQCGPLGEVK